MNKIPQLDWKKCEGLVPAIVQDSISREVLMLGYMNEESLAKTLESGLVTFFSRSRQTLWTKGESSGHHLKLVSLKADCDSDTLLIQAIPHGPTCHLGSSTCFGDKPDTNLSFLATLGDVIEQRFASADTEQSYVAKLKAAGLDRMAQKVGEEAVETVIAAKNSDLAGFEGEAADLLFHLMVLLKAKGSSLPQLAATLKQRHSK